MSALPGFQDMQGYMVTKWHSLYYLATSGSKSKIHGPEHFITVSHASCVSTIKGELRSSEAIYHKIHHKILRLLQKNELATFYSFDEIRKKLREPQVWWRRSVLYLSLIVTNLRPKDCKKIEYFSKECNTSASANEFLVLTSNFMSKQYNVKIQ